MGSRGFCPSVLTDAVINLFPAPGFLSNPTPLQFDFPLERPQVEAKIGLLSRIDLIKLAILLPLFCAAAPLGGVLLKGRPRLQHVVFALMCFLTLGGVMGPANFGLTPGSIEWYRGHTKGFHFFYNQALALALIVAARLEGKSDFRWIPLGGGLYLLYCFLSTISIFNAPNKSMVLMTLHKQLMAGLVFVAAYNFLKTEDRLKFFVRVMAACLIWEAVVCLKWKYLNGIYQVRGTFEHQNSLSMYCEMIGPVLLAVSMGPPFRGSNFTFLGFLAAAVIVETTMSRAGMVMFAAGTAGVMAVSLMERPTGRRLAVTAAMGLLGTIGILLAIDSIVARFHDRGNKASEELREVMKHTCREMVKDHPFGVGWNNYALMVNPPFRYAEIYYAWVEGRGMRVNPEKPNAVVESHYYLLLAENGYLGLLSYLVFIGVALWRNAKGFFFFGHSFLRWMSFGIAVGCGLNYVHSTLERVLTQPRNLMLWLILLGVTGRIETIRRRLKQERKLALVQTEAP